MHAMFKLIVLDLTVMNWWSDTFWLHPILILEKRFPMHSRGTSWKQGQALTSQVPYHILHQEQRPPTLLSFVCRWVYHIVCCRSDIFTLFDLSQHYHGVLYSWLILDSPSTCGIKGPTSLFRNFLSSSLGMVPFFLASNSLNTSSAVFFLRPKSWKLPSMHSKLIIFLFVLAIIFKVYLKIG